MRLNQLTSDIENTRRKLVKLHKIKSGERFICICKDLTIQHKKLPCYIFLLKLRDIENELK